jgi:hypothetical protein
VGRDLQVYNAAEFHIGGGNVIRQTVGSRQLGLAVLLSLSTAAPLLASQNAVESPTKQLTAVVLSVSDQSLKVLTRERDVTFVVSRNTKVIGKGHATLLPPAGRRWHLADALQQGDAVKIVYREVGSRKVAIRIERLNTER